MGSLIYKKRHYKVFKVYTRKPRVNHRGKYIPKGTPYYTVVNTHLNVHRHYDYRKQAIMICKRAGQCVIPKHYSKKARKDILYLMTGDKSIYE